MGNRILFIGTVLFATHVAFGDILVALPQPPQVLTQQPSLFEREIASSLLSRGMEPQAAESFAKESVADANDAMLLTHLLSIKTGIENTKVYEYVATKALFKQCVDLRAYDDVIAMVQKIKGVSISKNDFQAVKEYMAII
jgi:hypothetical protein